MRSLTQSQLLDAVEHDRRDRARFFRAARHDDLDCLSATYFTHRFPIHTHDTYVFGVVTAGCNAYRQRGELVRAGAGDLCFINPGEPHDGGAHEASFSYRMIYPDAAWMRALAEDVAGRGRAAAPFFAPMLTRDAEVIGLFQRAHAALEQGAENGFADELLIASAGLALARHADVAAQPCASATTRIARVRAALDDAPQASPDLAELARLAGLSRFHLLRAFRRETGLTPHAYLIDARVRMARRRLKQGEAPASVAAACGFADQAHFTRAFKARMGVTPGAFRRLARA